MGAQFVSKMAVDVGEDVGAMSHVGDEWSSRADLEEVVRDFILVSTLGLAAGDKTGTR
jgi:hypothetical protein